MSLLAGFLAATSAQPVSAESRQWLAAAVDGTGVAKVNVHVAAPVGLAHGRRIFDAPRNDNFDAPECRLRIVADVRLDNREALASALGVARTPDVSDAALILAAYRRWGHSCCDRLVGDFAFALWDEAEKALFCARDPMGVRPFYYRHDNAGFLFASRAPALYRKSDPPNERRIAAFLAGIDDDVADTATSGVSRLPPGHWMVARPGQTEIRGYFSLSPDRNGDRDFAEVFREILAESVAARLRSPVVVGGLLSGGLDSSSLVSLAASLAQASPEIRVPTFSFVYPENSVLDETRFIEIMRAAHPLDAAIIPLGPGAPLSRLDDLAGAGVDLYYGPGLPKIATLLAVAVDKGHPVLLDGHGGDEVASHGYGRLAELATQNRWLTLHRQLRAVAPTFGESSFALFAQYFLAHSLQGRLRPVLRRLQKASSTGAALDANLLEPAFAARNDIPARLRAQRSILGKASATEELSHRHNLTSPAVARSFEGLAHIADLHGCELRFPFFDTRLVQFALTIPSDEKLRDGFPRSVLRRAMQGALPPPIQWRRDKVDFLPEFHESLAKTAGGRLDEMRRSSGPLGAYVDVKRLGDRIDGLLAGAPARAGDVMVLWRCLLLAGWLDRRGDAAPEALRPVPLAV